MTATRRLLIALAAIAACALLSACGSSSSDSSVAGKSASDVLKETFGPDHPVRSGKLNLTLAVSSGAVSGLDGPVKASLTGPFQSQGGKELPSFDLDLALNAGGQGINAGATSTGSKGFISLAGTTYDVGDQLYTQFKTGYEAAQKDADKNKSKNQPTLAALGIDPQRWLSNATKVGDEQVGGVDAVHVSAPIDVAKLLADVNTLLGKAGSLGVPQTSGATSLSAKTRQTIEQAVKSAKLDVWSGKDDGTLRRLRVAVSFDVPSAQRSSVAGLQSGDITLDLSFSELNEKQAIAAPKGAKPFSELQSALGQLGLGATTTGSSGSSGSSGSAGSGSAAGSSKYLQCLDKAGSDLSKVQQCASLLGQ